MTIPPPTDDLRKRAEAGDARAQYALAARLGAEGRADEADRWLKDAAAKGEPDALYTLATRELRSRKGVPEALRLLTAARGSAAAVRLLAVLAAEGLGMAPDAARARALVMEAARAGDVAAMREIAGLLFFRDREDADGAALIARAAVREPVAGAVLVRRATLGRGDKALAEAALRKLQSIGYPRAADLARGLGAAAPAPSSVEPDWRRIEEKLSASPAAMPRLETLSTSPDIRVARAAAPPEILEYVIAVAAQRLAPSMTFDPMTGAARVDPYRTSATATLGPVDQDLVIVEVNRRLARIAGIDSAHGEFLSVLRYAPGEEYKPHFDWIPQAGEDFRRGGQRIKTALLYLNDDYEGGETEFLSNGLKFRDAAGDVLVFSNVCADGTPAQDTRHAGLPVRSGVKWLGSKWFRERPYEF